MPESRILLARSRGVTQPIAAAQNRARTHHLKSNSFFFRHIKYVTMTVPSSALLSAHRDVLEASIPETPEAKARLLEELKSRGRGAVSAKAWRDAELLYKRGIEIEPEAVLYANLALVQSNMGHDEEARQSALAATEQDPSYLKGFWRLGQALSKLGQTQDALQAMETALQLDPDNKALQKEVNKLKTQVREEEDLMDVEIPIASTEMKTTTTTVPVKKTMTCAPVKKTNTTTETTIKDTDGDDVFTKSDHVKGYKVVNGKKTSYFHRELTEEEKEIIGDIAPKRLESVNAPPQQQEPTDGSAWNKAGTWEERNVTAWAKETLEATLLTTSYTLPESSPAPGAVVKVSSVTKCDGHASFATVRGKKRYIYEFSISLQWEFDHDTHAVKGKMSFPDVDGTCQLGEGYDMLGYEVMDKDTPPPSLKPVLDRFVKNGGLRDAIHNCLDDWVRLFRATY
jgi:tetratricopeptide (TPR) repeat protein